MTHPMDTLPFKELLAILDNPIPVGPAIMELLWWWMRPKKVSSNQIIEAMIDAELASTKSEARRLINQGGVIWNGQKVTRAETALDFIDNQWGVFKIGKFHRMVVSDGLE